MAIALNFNEDQAHVMSQLNRGQGSAMILAARWGYLGTTPDAGPREGRTDDEWLRDLVNDLEYEVIEAIETIDRLDRPDSIDLADRETLQTVLVMCQDYLADYGDRQ